MSKIANVSKIVCCICENPQLKDNVFIPRICLNKNGMAAHRICKTCWWNTFYAENKSHECPGCIKGLPLNLRKETWIINVDLTDE